MIQSISQSLSKKRKRLNNASSPELRLNIMLPQLTMDLCGSAQSESVIYCGCGHGSSDEAYFVSTLLVLKVRSRTVVTFFVAMTSTLRSIISLPLIICFHKKI